MWLCAMYRFYMGNHPLGYLPSPTVVIKHVYVLLLPLIDRKDIICKYEGREDSLE